MKQTSITVFVGLFLLFVTTSSLKLYFDEHARAERLTDNIEALNSEAETFRAKNGQQASRIAAQEVTIKELKNAYPEIVAQLKNLSIQPRRVQSYTQTSQQLKAEIKTVVRDSLIYRQDTVKMLLLQHRDKWMQIRGEVYPDTAKISVSASDSIFIATHRGRRYHPAAWVLSRRRLETTATNVNPYISICVVSSGTVRK